MCPCYMYARATYLMGMGASVEGGAAQRGSRMQSARVRSRGGPGGPPAAAQQHCVGVE